MCFVHNHLFINGLPAYVDQQKENANVGSQKELKRMTEGRESGRISIEKCLAFKVLEEDWLTDSSSDRK